VIESGGVGPSVVAANAKPGGVERQALGWICRRIDVPMALRLLMWHRAAEQFIEVPVRHENGGSNQGYS
jgi:hypothetical protein